MKKIFFLLLFGSKLSYAQFTMADLKASGLTCSMCNLATQKQLQTLNFVDSIVPDLELNAFHIYFNQQHEIDFGLIKKKVEDAGFFVAELKVTYSNKKPYKMSNSLMLLEHSVLFIKDFKEQKEPQVFKFIDEGFVTTKQYKKNRKIISEMVLPSASKDIQLLINLKMYHVIAE